MIPQAAPGAVTTRRTAPLLSIIIPTRNEREVVGPLLDRLDRSLGAIDAELVFVDDSDDGTDDLLAGAETRQDLTVLHRAVEARAGGLSTAVDLGFRQSRGDFICVIDADLQHPPERVLELLAAAQAGADIVVASRYMPGGRADGLDGALRRLLSRAACILTRTVFSRRLSRISDPLSGFFVVRREVVAEVHFRPIGFKILLEVLVRGNWTTAAEVPYRFEGRTAGVSKATLGQGAQFIRHLLRLRLT